LLAIVVVGVFLIVFASLTLAYVGIFLDGVLSKFLDSCLLVLMYDLSIMNVCELAINSPS